MKRSTFFLLLTAMAALAGLAGYEAREVARGQTSLAATRQRVDRLAAQLAELRPQRDLAQRELEAATQRLTETTSATPGNSTSASEVGPWLARVKRLQQAFDEQPNHRIPELALLSDLDWVRLTRTLALESDADLRKAKAVIRSAGVEAFLKRLQVALENYATAANGAPLTDLTQVIPYIKPPIDPAILQRYAITGERGNDPQRDRRTIRERAPIDEAVDFRHGVSVSGEGTTQSSWAAQILSQAQDDAFQAFTAANGRAPSKAWETLPYVTNPAVKGLWEAMTAYEKDHYGQQPSGFTEVSPYVKDAATRALLEKLALAERPRGER